MKNGIQDYDESTNQENGCRMPEYEPAFVICPICGDRVLEGHTNLQGVCPDCEDEAIVEDFMNGRR